MSHPESTWSRLESLFTQALDLPPESRRAFITRECSGDTLLREELQRLLDAKSEAGEFLAPPTLKFSGHRFGNYEALSELGRGGMSVVYKGRRHEDFEKSVAIKILLLQPNQSIQASETQILARLLDAGSTSSGFRFLVMEFIDGVPCSTYAANLPIHQRLRLFLAICRAVQYAHQSLIVHRDLKPANILVTADGTPKLLDFGIAKLLSTDTTLAQTQGIRAYTPDYASPEQILGQPVTTASDVYSLGALLCEILSGKPPRNLNTLSTADLISEIQRDSIPDLPFSGDLALIAQKALRRLPAERYQSAADLASDIERYLNNEPILARPASWSYHASKFIHRHKLAVAASTLAIAALIGTTTWALIQSNLATSRFEQVRRLASKLLFEIHDAVEPLPGSLAASKLITASSTEYLDAISSDPRASLDVQLDVIRGYLRLAAISGKDIGDRSMGDSSAAESLANRAVLAGRRTLSQYPASTDTKALLADALTSLAAAKSLRNQPQAAVTLLDEAIQLATPIATTNPRKARLSYILKSASVPRFALDESDAAFALLNRSLELNKQLYAAEPSSPTALQRLAEIHMDLSLRLATLRDFAKADSHSKEAYRLNAIRYQANPRAVRLPFSASIGQLATSALRAKDFPEAIRLYREMLEIRREIAAEDPNDTNAQVRLATAFDRLGNTLSNAQQHPEALRQLDTALQLIRKLHTADPANSNTQREFLYTLGDLSEAHGRAGNPAKACAFAKEFLANLKSAGPSTLTALKRHTDRATDRAKSCR